MASSMLPFIKIKSLSVEMYAICTAFIKLNISATNKFKNV